MAVDRMNLSKKEADTLREILGMYDRVRALFIAEGIIPVGSTNTDLYHDVIKFMRESGYDERFTFTMACVFIDSEAKMSHYKPILKSHIDMEYYVGEAYNKWKYAISKQNK